MRKAMPDERLHHHRDELDTPRRSIDGADILAALAVASFLAAIGLIAFFVTSALAS